MLRKILLLLGALTMTTLAVQAPAQAEDDDVTNNSLSHDPDIVDRVLMFQGSDFFTTGTMENTVLVGGATPRVMLDNPRKGFPRSGRFTTEEIIADFPFTEIMPSWNPITPPDTGMVFHLRTRDEATQDWSPWLYMGQWGRTVHWPTRTTEFPGGEVRVDYLILKQPADAFQFRISLFSFDMDMRNNPAVRRVAFSYSGRIADPATRERLLQKDILDGEWARRLPVPFYTQGDLDRSISGSTCSPTSVSMLLSYHGIDKPLLENCMAIYDPEYGIFGNWNRAVAYPGELGLKAYLRRFRNWEQVKAMIAKDQPVIASIRFKEGEFPSNPMKSTGGHLIVVIGFTPEGDVIVNDSAHRTEGMGIVYKADELGRAWFDKGGVGYIVEQEARPARRQRGG